MFINFLVVFIIKTIEVSLSTIKTVFITKKKKLFSMILGFLEILIWINLVNTVLSDLSQSPEKMFAYALGYSLGILVGLMIEDFIPIGNITLHVTLNEKNSHTIINKIRDSGFAVTSFKGEGISGEKIILILHMKKKRKNKFIELINLLDEPYILSIVDANTLKGGYL